MTEKVVGYSLLIFGIFLIIAATISVFMVFTKQAPPIQLFHTTGVSLDFGKITGLQTASAPQEVIPAALIDDSANILAHVFLMGFIAGVGQKLASLGVQLIRPIVVNLKEKVV